jgi:hypothetical protein
VRDAAQLAIEAPAPVGARAAAVLADLLASAGIAVGRTGSAILVWPNDALPYNPAAWAGERPLDLDPLAFAFRHLHGPPASGWAAPVDAVRGRVAEWARAERLRVEPTWPGGATCAIAIVHEARALERPRTGLRGALGRRRADTLEAERRAAEAARAAGVRAAVRSTDLLAPDEQAQVRSLGFSLATGTNVRIASRPGFGRGTAFPTRGYDRAGERVDAWAELPLLGETPDPGLAALLEQGGGAVLSVPMARFAGEDGAVRVTAFADDLERLRALGAWLTTPEDLARHLYGG